MHMKVRDVMTRKVVAVTGATSYRDVAQVLIDRGVSAVPVVDERCHVIGVISEADLLRKEEFREQYYGEDYRPPLRQRLREQLGRRGTTMADRARGDTAADLMSAPPVTTRPYISVVSAARIMAAHEVKRLPVVNDDGRLEGIVSRHDLLRVLARTDDDIAREIHADILDCALWTDTSGVRVQVTDGVVTLTGKIARHSDARILVRMTERVNGVSEVLDRLEWEVDDLSAGARR
ncbi:CBS domain-containing protein [Microbispora sp. RL4-1S]|uniref:CBS domain-containing protein n=1 Tax=Microbispora oryzae TaxID=2806554 RepID=A0A941AHC1_9ACTN|nr:CBS domain-containing protein [Microbispora oryzae]MBP2703930.1 CBS domain-containing protein [Microbispora oryzae]